MLSVVADEAVRTELHADLDELTRPGAQRMRLRSVILSPWCRSSPKVAEVVPRALAEVWDATDRDHAGRAIETFFDFPAEHWLHPRTSNPIESTFGRVRIGDGVQAAGGRPGPLASSQRPAPGGAGAARRPAVGVGRCRRRPTPQASDPASG
jgi:hypothetical protein